MAGGANSQQAYDVVLTSMRRNDVVSTLFRRHVPTRFLIKQCEIITFLILKSDSIANSRIELKGIVLPVPSILLLHYLSTWYICDFFLFHIQYEGKCGWIIGGGGGGGEGGAKGMFAPLSKIIGASLPPHPPPPHPHPPGLLFLRLCKEPFCSKEKNKMKFQL